MGKLFVVGTPIGNLGDMTPRAVEVLRSVDLVAAEDTRVTGKLFNMLGIDAPLVSYHKFNERERSKELAARLREPEFKLGLVSDAGMPAVSDPGAFLVAEARRVGADILSVPGASAATTALSVSGFSGTRFSFMGFFPRKANERADVLAEIRNGAVSNYVFYESPERIRECLKIIATVLGDGARVSVSKELTKMFEKTVAGEVGEVIAAVELDAYAERGEYVVVVNNEDVKSTCAKESDDAPCLEALLVQTAFAYGLSLKDAAARVRAEDKKHKKSELYAAAERLKALLRAAISAE